MITMTWPQYKRRECSVDGKIARLSGHEAEIVSTLLMRHPAPVSRTDLIEALWPDADREPDWSANSISVYMLRLRRKIGRQQIRSWHGVGYTLSGQFETVQSRLGFGPTVA